MHAQMLAEPGTTVAQAEEQKFLLLFFKKEGLACFETINLQATVSA